MNYWLMKNEPEAFSIDDLEQLRTYPALEDMNILQRGNRLSITPLDKKPWDFIEKRYIS